MTAKRVGGIFDLMTKEVRKQDTPQDRKCDSHLSLLQRLHAGQRPAQIAHELGIPKETLQYHLNRLKTNGLVRKVGYGCWEVTASAEEVRKQDSERSAKTTQVTLDKTPKKCEYSGCSDRVRGHAFVFVLKVPPALLNWTNSRREAYLDRLGINFSSLRILGGGERLWLEGRKVWLTNNSVIIYEKSSFFADTAKDARKHALITFIGLVKKLERLLHADFTFRAGREYRFKVSRQHYALVRNALAEQYDREGKRLQVREAETGKLWFVIDNSFNLHEAETLHPVSAQTDNEKVQAWFNSLKAQPVTTGELLQAIAGVTQNQLLFAENIDTHIQAIRDLGTGVRELNRLLAELENAKR